MLREERPVRDGAVAKSKIYQAIAQARASLAEPSRPFTPAEPSRHLFRPSASDGGYASSRPSSAFKIGASSFVVGGAGASLRPSAVGDAEVLSLRDNDDDGTAPAPPIEQQRWWEQAEALLHELRAGAGAESIVAACDALWDQLKPPNGPGGPQGVAPVPAADVSRRSRRILEVVAPLLERKEAPVLLRLCRLVLVATGDNVGAQLGACKLAFKLSKTEANDRLFRELGLLPLLLGIVQSVPQPPAIKAGATTGGDWKPTSAATGMEVALYAAGALKNVSADANNQRSLVQLGAVGAFAAVLRGQMAALAAMPGSNPASVVSTPRGGVGAEGSSAAVRPVHLLVQVSATLRNLAVSGSSRKQFVSSGCVEELCRLLQLTPQHAELCMNVSRVLAKLSLHEDVRRRIDAEPRHLQSLLRVLQTHHADRPLLIRICFILGNLSASNSRSREAMASAVLPQLLQLLRLHTGAVSAAAPLHPPKEARKETKENCAPAGGPSHADMGTSMQEGEAHCVVRSVSARSGEVDEGKGEALKWEAKGGEGGEADAGCAGQADPKEAERQAERFDVLVKLIRLLAHLAISRAVGEKIAAAPELESLLLLLERFSADGAQEELVLNTVSAITNVTFYIGPEDPAEANLLLAHHTRLVRVLLGVLAQPNDEGVVEAARALGNLSRREEVRRAICAEGVHEALLLLLDHSSPQVAEATCGALINLAADSSQSIFLLRSDAARRLVELMLHLLTAPPTDASAVPALILATKSLCNLCCACTESPLPRQLQATLLPQLEHAVPPTWAAAPVAFPDERSASEWQQASQLLLMLLLRFPDTDVGTEAVERGEPDELDELEELPAPDCD